MLFDIHIKSNQIKASGYSSAIYTKTFSLYPDTTYLASWQSLAMPANILRNERYWNNLCHQSLRSLADSILLQTFGKVIKADAGIVHVLLRWLVSLQSIDRYRAVNLQRPCMNATGQVSNSCKTIPL